MEILENTLNTLIEEYKPDGEYSKPRGVVVDITGYIKVFVDPVQFTAWYGSIPNRLHEPMTEYVNADARSLGRSVKPKFVTDINSWHIAMISVTKAGWLLTLTVQSFESSDNIERGDW